MQAEPRRLSAVLLAMVVAAATAGSINAEATSITASVSVIPIAIALDLSTLNARVGEAVRVRATITNAGPTLVTNVTVELRVNTSGLRVRGGPTATISRLQPGRSAAVTWTVCPIQGGSYLVLARASVGEALIESDARLLTVAGQRKRRCT